MKAWIHHYIDLLILKILKTLIISMYDVPDIYTKMQTHNNPHYWLQQDLLQVTNSQYQFFQNITLTDDTIPQIKVFSHFS